MRLIAVFLWASSASAAVFPIFARQMAVEFNRKMKRNGGNLPDFHVPFDFDLPAMIPAALPSLVPVSFCDSGDDSVKKRLKLEKRQNASEQPKAENHGFDWRTYEKLLAKEDHAGIAAAFKNGAIDFSYIPRKDRFYRVLLDMESAEGNEIIRKYFESGAFEEMRQLELLKYPTIMEAAVRQDNYFVANLALTYMIAAMQKEAESDAFNESEWRMSQKVFVLFGYKHLDQVPDYKIFSFWYYQLTPNEKEMFKFYGKYNRIFVNSKLRHWKMGTSEFPIFLMY